jgi:hypothetical protein
MAEESIWHKLGVSKPEAGSILACWKCREIGGTGPAHRKIQTSFNCNLELLFAAVT